MITIRSYFQELIEKEGIKKQEPISITSTIFSTLVEVQYTLHIEDASFCNGKFTQWRQSGKEKWGKGWSLIMIWKLVYIYI